MKLSDNTDISVSRKRMQLLKSIKKKQKIMISDKKFSVHDKTLKLVNTNLASLIFNSW